MDRTQPDPRKQVVAIAWLKSCAHSGVRAGLALVSFLAVCVAFLMEYHMLNLLSTARQVRSRIAAASVDLSRLSRSELESLATEIDEIGGELTAAIGPLADLNSEITEIYQNSAP